MNCLLCKQPIENDQETFQETAHQECYDKAKEYENDINQEMEEV